MPFLQKPRKMPRVLAVASGGSHWMELLRLRASFEGAEVHYATVDASAAEMVSPAPVHIIPDLDRGHRLRAILRIWLLLVHLRPDVVISTGGMSGYHAIRFARRLGARCLFIDSIANARALSPTAEACKGVADRVISQWPEVARRSGTEFWGAVL